MSGPDPVFARDPATAVYYDQRAEEYDEWYLGQGRFASRDRPGWEVEVERVIGLGSQLEREIAGEVLLEGDWFVAARAGTQAWPTRPLPVPP